MKRSEMHHKTHNSGSHGSLKIQNMQYISYFFPPDTRKFCTWNTVY